MKIGSIKLTSFFIFSIVLFTVINKPQKLYGKEHDGLPFTFRVVEGSRQVVMVQDQPWEEQMMAYYKVLKVGRKKWQMW